MDVFKIEKFDFDLKKKEIFFKKNLNQLIRHHYKILFL